MLNAPDTTDRHGYRFEELDEPASAPRLCTCGKPATVTVNAPLKPTAPDGESFNIEVCAGCFDALWTHNAIIRATNEAPEKRAGEAV